MLYARGIYIYNILLLWYESATFFFRTRKCHLGMTPFLFHAPRGGFCCTDSEMRREDLGGKISQLPHSGLSAHERQLRGPDRLQQLVLMAPDIGRVATRNLN
jgi:hypothetical protein